MPPKPKFTKEEIASAALAIIKENGVNALTARELGSRLGSSARPIFTTFKNMAEVKWAAREIVMREFEAYASDYVEYTPAFKRIGMLMVNYAINEPELYKLLFMQENPNGRTLKDTFLELGDIPGVCMKLIRRDYGMTEEEAAILFEQMWVYTFGMGALCAMKVCDFTEDEIAEKLGRMFAGMVMVIKSGKLNRVFQHPEKGTPGSYHGIPVSHLPFMQD